MLYLSRLCLNPRSWAARRDLGNDYQMHSTLSRGIGSPTQPRSVGPVAEDKEQSVERLLFRVDTVEGRLPYVLVQSLLRPDWTFLEDERWRGYLSAKPDVKDIELALHADQVLRFRLRANPTRKLTQAGRKTRVSLLGLEAQLDWLQRKLTDVGAELQSVRAIQEGLSRSKKHSSGEDSPLQTLFAVRFEGVLRVLGPERLRAGVAGGIGSGKGYGFGLLSLAPA